MSTFRINGGKTLKGTIETNAGKNAPIAILCAALMVKGRVVLKDMTHVEEVLRMLEILESIGVTYHWLDNATLVLDTGKPLTMKKINVAATEKTRASLLFLGALAAREQSYKLPNTGGCKLGERTIRPHLYGLEKLGLTVKTNERQYEVKTKKLAAAHVVMYESGDTATENVIMAAVLAPGVTTITFASANYMVQDLCHFLIAAGAKIEGVGSTSLTITGVKKLHAVEGYYLTPDPVDAMAWISLAITTGSPLTIKNCPLDFLELELLKLEVMGQKYTVKNKRKAKSGNVMLGDIQIIPGALKALPDKLYGRPFPGVNIDNVPLFLPILTQAVGQTLVHDWCYENRAIYYVELKKLGANVLLLDPHRALVEGKTELRPNDLICPPAIRPGMAIFIAMLAAKGTSVLRNCYPLERAYDGLLERLWQIGADVERLEDDQLPIV